MGAAASPVAAGRRRYILVLLDAGLCAGASSIGKGAVDPGRADQGKDLHLKDADIGILTGQPIFVIFYTFLGVPIAWAADRTSRPAIIAGSLALWERVWTRRWSGFAGGFVTLGLARLEWGSAKRAAIPRRTR